MKAWKRDMGRIRELGPDEPHFNSAVERVWDHIERLEMALRRIGDLPSQHVRESEWQGIALEAENIASEALVEGEA